MEFTFGSDPEFMLEKGGKFFSAIEIIPGTKNHRFAIGKHSVYYDNVMAECAVLPGKTKRQTIANIRDCLQRLPTLVKPYRVVTRASQEFTKDQLQAPEAGRGEGRRKEHRRRWPDVPEAVYCSDFVEADQHPGRLGEFRRDRSGQGRSGRGMQERQLRY